MSETLAAPILDPSELSPEDMDAIHEAERVINESLDRYIAVADTPNARKDVTESIERQATADPKAFLAAREQLSNFTDEDDPTDEQIEKEDVLPRLSAQRPRLDFVQADAAGGQRLEQLGKHADFVLHGAYH